MLLVLTNSADATADYLVSILERRYVDTLRVDTDLVTGAGEIHYDRSGPSIVVGGRRILPGDVSNIWYRRPERLKDGRFGDGPEGRLGLAEWAEAIEALLAHVPPRKWMNHPAANSGASHKLLQLTVAGTLGFKVPATLLTMNPDEARAFFRTNDGRVIVKPLSAAYLERADGRDSLIYTNAIGESHLEHLDDLLLCPTLFQQRISKELDVRITIVDSEIHGMALHACDERGEQRCDIRRNNMVDVRYSQIEIPQQVESCLRRMMEHFALRFAAVDMVVSNAGDWFFLEVNPNGQWAWLDLDGGAQIAESFVRAFDCTKDVAQ